jgi:hypothetical protein
MKNIRLQFWAKWGLVSRLMLAVGLAIVAGGGVQTYLLLAEGAAEHSARLQREMTETLTFLAPLVADQAILGEYAAISQLLRNQVKKGEVDRLEWTDKAGKKTIAQDKPDVLVAPSWFASVAAIDHAQESADVSTGGVSYGTLVAKMTPVRASGVTRLLPCCTASTSTPMAIAKAVGSRPCNSTTVHQATARGLSARGSAAKKSHSLRARSRWNTCTASFLAGPPEGAYVPMVRLQADPTYCRRM